VSYSVLLHPKAARFLEKADVSLRDQVKQCLRELENSPERRGERLKQSQFWRVRVSDYRAIYEIDRERKMVIILFIGHRKDVYDDFSRLLD
jgi:mRNA interferase RelE/StbE